MLTVEEILRRRRTRCATATRRSTLCRRTARVGFYRARTHEVIECEQCLLVKSEADAAAEALREYMQSCRVAGYDEKIGPRPCPPSLCPLERGGREPCLRARERGQAAAGGNGSSRFCAVRARSAPASCWARIRKRATSSSATATARSGGTTGLRIRSAARRSCLSVPSFYQVNRTQAERLYAKAIEFADLTGRETVLDLYCGAGTITLALSDHAKKVLGAEIVPEAIDDARENAVRNGVRNVEFFCGDASDVAKKLAQRTSAPRCHHR